MFGVSALLALASLLLLSPNLQLVGIAYGVLGIIAFIGLQRLHVPELLELRRAIARGIRRSSTIGQNVALREALDTMAEMDDPRAALEELGRAFERTDFLEAELRLIGATENRDTDRVVWMWRRPQGATGSATPGPSQVIDLAAARDSRNLRSDESLVVRSEPLPRPEERAEAHWEARLPLIDDVSGAIEGWLTIRRPWGTYLPSELDMLARRLLPETLTKESTSGHENRQVAAADVVGSRASPSVTRRAGQVGGGPPEVGV
jgi:hypothetical protein